MKAVVLDSFGAAEQMRPCSAPAPSPEPGEVLIEIHAAAVNRPDILQREGKYPPPLGASEILGLECAGRIAELGAGVSTHAVGDPVFALLTGGGYAEFAVAQARHVLPIPTGMDFVPASAIAETYITAWHNLFENAALTDGDSVLLHGGGGGVNTAGIQLVSALCPNSEIIVTASAAKLDRVAALGAGLVIDYAADDFAEKVKQHTDGRGVDVILDHIGAAYLEQNLQALAINGRLVVIGIMQGSDAELSLGRLMVKRQRIIGSVLRPRPDDEKAAIIGRFADAVMPLFASNRIEPLIDRVFALDDVVAAHRLMESSGHFGKIVLQMRQEGDASANA